MNEVENIVDINRATLEELQQIPGVGPSIAERITAARPFSHLDDLKRVSGIGDALLESLRPHITLSSAVINDESGAPNARPSEQGSELQNETLAGLELRAQQDIEAPELQEILTQEAQPKEMEAGVELSEEEEQLLIEAEMSEAADDQPAPVLEASAAQEQPHGPPASAPTYQAPSPAAGAAAMQTQAYTRNQTLWLTLGASVLTLVISVVAILGILLILNGGLSYVRPGEFTTLRRQVNALEAQASGLEQDLQGLRNRMQNLEALSGRVSTLEGNLEQIQSDVSSATKKIAEFDQRIGAMDKQIEELRTSSSRFQTFLEGLSSLLGDLVKP
jgi:competence ComEA-like helix-hairpin-helix protein